VLNLKRKERERIRLRTADGEVWIEVLEIYPGFVRLGVDAPQSVRIEREEIIDGEGRE
jgi:carbon storage regulator CsrA